MDRYESTHEAKYAFVFLMLCSAMVVATARADVLADLKSVKIDGRKYIGSQIIYIAHDVENRGNAALANVGKDGFNIRMGGMMGGASYLFRDVELRRMSIYDAISQIARAAGCIVYADERTVVVEPKDESMDEAAHIDKIVLDAKCYESEPLTNIVNDVWRRTNDMLFETARWGIVVDYPNIVTNLSISIPTTNALESFKLLAKSIQADISFDGYFLDMSISTENTEVASLLKSIYIDDLDIPAGTRFYDGMESLRRKINLGLLRNEGEPVKFEYRGAQTNLPIAAIRLANISAFEAVCNICHQTHRTFFCDATSRTVYMGLDEDEYAERFKRLRFQGGHFYGDTVFKAFQALLFAVNANLEQNDMLTVGAAMPGLRLMDRPLCIDIKPCTTWEAFEHFARITSSKVVWEHSRVLFTVDDALLPANVKISCLDDYLSVKIVPSQDGAFMSESKTYISR